MIVLVVAGATGTYFYLGASRGGHSGGEPGQPRRRDSRVTVAVLVGP